MYEISERWLDENVGKYLAVNEIDYAIRIVWSGGKTFTAVYSADLQDEEALYLTLTYSDVVATKLDK